MYCMKKTVNNCKNTLYVSEDEQVIVNTRNSFELDLVLLNKRNKSIWLREQIKNRIQPYKKDSANLYYNTTKELLNKIDEDIV